MDAFRNIDTISRKGSIRKCLEEDVVVKRFVRSSWNYFWDHCPLIILAGLIAGGSYIYLNQEKTLTLNKDFCPSQGPTHTVAILLDTTERIAEATQISARKK